MISFIPWWKSKVIILDLTIVYEKSESGLWGCCMGALVPFALVAWSMSMVFKFGPFECVQDSFSLLVLVFRVK